MWYINKSTETNSGSGLPVTKHVEYLNTVRNKGAFSGGLGLWRVPIGTLPTFQIIVPEDTFVGALLVETTGEGVFTGSTVIPVTPFVNTNITKNGDPFTVWQIDPTYVLAGATEGRYLIDLTLSLSAVDQHYYSEEFIMSDCC